MSKPSEDFDTPEAAIAFASSLPGGLAENQIYECWNYHFDETHWTVNPSAREMATGENERWEKINPADFS